MRIKDQPISAREYLEKCPRGGTASQLHRFPSVANEPINVYSIHDAIVVGQPALILTPFGDILYESSAYRDFPEQLRSRIVGTTVDDSQARACADAQYCLLCGIWDDQFWHWIMDYLPRAIIAEAAGFTGRYVIPAQSEMARESLDMLGISASRLVVYDGGPVRILSLLVVQSIDGFGGLPNHPSLIYELRNQLLAASSKLNDVGRGERLYVARKILHRPRKVVNEQDFLNVVRPLGFERVYMEEHSLRKQIAIASKARVLVGPHGSGMVHALFMPRQSAIIECFSPHYILTSHVQTLSLMGHRYFAIVGSHGPLWPYSAGMDVLVDIALFKITLARELREFPLHDHH